MTRTQSFRAAFLLWGLVIVPVVAWYVGVIRLGRPLAVVLAIGAPALATALVGFVMRRPAFEVLTVSFFSSALVVLGLFLALVVVSLGGGFEG